MISHYSCDFGANESIGYRLPLQIPSSLLTIFVFVPKKRKPLSKSFAAFVSGDATCHNGAVTEITEDLWSFFLKAAVAIVRQRSTIIPG